MSKTALITGATSGIGYELSKVFAKNRYNFMMTPAEVAEIGFSGLRKGKTIVIPGLVNKIQAFSARLFPRSVITAITAYVNHEKN